MATIALVILGLTLTLGFGVRVLVQLRRTGSTGVRILVSGASPLERLAVGTLALAAFIGALAPTLQLRGDLEPISVLDVDALQALGVALGLVGCGLVFISQLAMGDSWRSGVDAEERTVLVTDGLFSFVRNRLQHDRADLPRSCPDARHHSRHCWISSCC